MSYAEWDHYMERLRVLDNHKTSNPYILCALLNLDPTDDKAVIFVKLQDELARLSAHLRTLTQRIDREHDISTFTAPLSASVFRTFSELSG